MLRAGDDAEACVETSHQHRGAAAGGVVAAVVAFFRTGPDQPGLGLDRAALRQVYERKRWSVFLSLTMGYGMFYTCRVNLSVVKKPLLDDHVLDATQLGLMGSALLLVYAVGRLANGFLADRSNVRRLMSVGLLCSAFVNLLIGFNGAFVALLLLWGLNGWFQSVGSAPSVVSLSQWFTTRERGTRYGIWSISHSLGEGLTFLVTSSLVAGLGWRWGFWGPGILCVGTAVLLSRLLSDRPQTYGLPPVWEYQNETTPQHSLHSTVGVLQKEVIKDPGVFLLGLAGACVYVARYGINNWGILYLQTAKGYALAEAGSLLAICPVASILGTVASGLVSDRFFASRRNVPALAYGLLNVSALLAFYWAPAGHWWLEASILAALGFALGGLVAYLGGLMAVDIVSQRAAGAAMGIVGVFCYAGATIQDTVSGYLIDVSKHVVGGQDVYSFDAVFAFWIGAAILSVLLACSVWRRRPAD